MCVLSSPRQIDDYPFCIYNNVYNAYILTCVYIIIVGKNGNSTDLFEIEINDYRYFFQQKKKTK